MEELLSLKWNNHRSTFLHILTILRDKQLYTDVTLACEGRFYSVHRLVLSTCSDYFSAMFDRTTCKNPIIVLKDIKCEDLEALLDYMYLGEVNVRQADLASLIKAAECLRVKGLAVPDDEPPPKRGRGGDSNFRKPDGSGSPPSKRKRRDEGQDGREDIRPGGGGGASRPKTPQSQSRLSPGPQEGSDATASPSHSQQQQQQQQASSDLLQQQQQQQQQQQPNAAPQSSAADEHQSPFVKVEMEDSGGDDMGGGDAFNINNDSFKEETSEDHVGDLSNDLPEFLQQSTDGSYSHSFAGPSFQPDLPNWQGDQVLSSNNFSGLGFPSQSQDGSQNTGTSGAGFDWTDCLVAPLPQRMPGGRRVGFDPPSFSTPIKPRGSGVVSSNCDSTEDGLAAGRQQKIRLHNCPVCHKAFSSPKDCRRHLLVHSGDKPFECPFCNHRANLSYNLKKHILTIHSSSVSSMAHKRS